MAAWSDLINDRILGPLTCRLHLQERFLVFCVSLGGCLEGYDLREGSTETTEIGY
jgi:hypothetical protein